MSLALANQINMNHLLSLMFSVSLVAGTAIPDNQSEFPTGVSSFAIPAEERPFIDYYVLAYINTTYMAEDGLFVHSSDEKSKYGEGKILNVEAPLVHVTAIDNIHDHTACERNLKGTHGKDLPTEPWVALVKRGRCNFEDKVQHVFEQHAIGVIVYNDKESPNLDKMRINNKERNITAVFTFKYKGEQLAKLLEEHQVNVSISEGSRGQGPPNAINRTSVLFVSISFIVLMIISLVWLIFYYVQRFRYLQTKDKQSRRLCSVAKRIISKIPTKNLRSDDKEVENDCCAVCIEPYKVADYLRILPCGHHFHKVCIDPWLLEHRTCPMCKMDILKHYGFVVGSQASTNTIIIDYMIGNDSNPIAQPRNNVASSNSSGNLSSISASNSSPNRSTNNSDDTESRQITDV